ncbi:MULTISPECIES: polysaccharide biosynthesis/export family protein [unclassified Ensifer]|uniref:polysaccharide biosynthesis/export family protein n=1 Tax=unclassified Ensifer TaxID=2633371 RepID=UPI0008134E43|nr:MULTISPECIES: polysaccharide biosynthesis/export family protein [unclassified Ensifer]OCP03396.1 sugar ABC transporter substrate-binding protein [Ensifer sp. LC14]OCP03728.1 sugar ABC transporter substrate-binding protein [Ensifer sp. LC11]OCP03877.1 sugar ABC transporter substrate-binding protein [Ensifer sp. LC13]OCP30291.1 sugar ABC transporter substrate-binding protein [Ensifer sp. LC499]
MKQHDLIGRSRISRTVPSFLHQAVLLVAVMLGAAQARAEEYQLGTMDKLKIRVAEWQTAEGAVRDWSVVSGEYTVGPSGALSLPFIGDLPAAGKTTTEVGEAIGGKMQTLFGLRDRPSASVELAQYRPVYLAGEVQKPGEYPFVPNLTVLKAVSLGGGLRRSESGQRFARDYINAHGESSVQTAERNRLLIRRARLQAEIADKGGIELPKDLQGVSGIDKLLANETALMASRDRKQKLQLKSLADLKSLLESEIQSLAKKSDTQNRQLELVMEDREKIEGLAEKGLALSQRKLQLEQRVAELQAAVLDIDTASLKAKQDVSKAAQDDTNLRNDWDAQLAQDLQNTEAELDTLSIKLGTSRDLMAEALLQSAEAAQMKDNTAEAAITYSIIRERDGKPTEVAADENTPVLPGDVIKAEANLATQ